MLESTVNLREIPPGHVYLLTNGDLVAWSTSHAVDDGASAWNPGGYGTSGPGWRRIPRPEAASGGGGGPHDHPLAEITDAGFCAGCEFGTGAGTVAEGNDPRLSDARTPLAHTHVLADVTDAGDAAGLDVGSGAGTVCAGNDGRLSDARTPLAHSHALADITDDGALAAKNTIATTDIDDDAVTYAKLQNVSAGDRLLGRISGAGNAEEVTCTAAGRAILDDADAAAQRTTLGLGDSATKNVGTGAGDVSAGNHTHAGGGFEFPVGYVLISTVNTNPATFLGYGTWANIGAGRVLVGLDSGDADFDTAGETGGAKTTTLTTTELPAHTHGVTDPQHAHVENNNSATTGGLAGWGARDTSTNTSVATGYSTAPASTGITVDSAGGGAAFSRMPPYLVTYFWERTA